MSGVCVLGFDMETDIGSWTPFYRGLEEGTPVILEILRRYEAEATFFFTGDAARTHPDVVASIRDSPHEVGCHGLYHETVGEELFAIPGIKPLLPQEVPLRLALATEWVRQACGGEAGGGEVVSFRAPRLWGSTAMVNRLEELGYVADASYPMYYYRDRLAPYHPSAEDWTREGSLRILEIPNFADMAMESSDRWGRDRDQWPLFRTEGAGKLLEHIDSFAAFAAARGVDPVVLCFYFHPWEFVEMPSGPIHYGEGSVIPDPFIVQNCGRVAAQQLSVLLGELTERGYTFQSARGLAATR